jgi:exodeoxyribonuclease V gamma subunit
MIVKPHHDMDTLVEQLASWLANQSRSARPIPFVVPSITFADYLRVKLAKRLGVCMGLDLLTPRDFAWRLFDGPVTSAWSPMELCWHLLPRIKSRASNLGLSPDASIRDQFAVASLVADTLDQYAHYRPDLIRQWASQNTHSDETSSEKWQKEIWLELNESFSGEHPAVHASNCFNDDAFLKNIASKYPVVVVIGSGAVDPFLVEALNLLHKAGSDVLVHVVLPSLEYLGDLRKRGNLPARDTSPEFISAPAGHPLLESMGRQAVGSFLLLGELDEQYAHWPEIEAEPDQGGTLLRRLQNDIRALRLPAVDPNAVDDGSIRVHCCHGARREIEVLRDELLRAFYELPDLHPEQIHIVTPALEEYAPLLPALLESASLSVRVTELPTVSQNQLVQALLAFLRLAQAGRFEASCLLELLQLPAVQRFLKIEDDDHAVERLRNWIVRSGLTRGLGAEQGGDLNPGTWRFASDRLAAGWWFGPKAEVETADGRPVLAVADELDGDAKLLGRFLCWQRDLAKLLHEWECVSVEPTHWASRLRKASLSLLDCEVGKDHSELQIHLDLLKSAPAGIQVDAAVISDWLEAAASDRARRTVLSGKITAGRFKQLQNIPCRVLAMIGMQDGSFPSKARPTVWNLLQEHPRAWDRNSRIDDRQMFLDSILATRERLIITASSQNVKTGKTEPLSSCVDELLRVCNQMGVDRESLVVQHALQPFSMRYFTVGGKLPQSFDRDMQQVASELQGTTHRAGAPIWKPQQAPVKMETPDEVNLADIISFWKDPAAAFLKARGIATGRDAEDDLDLDRHPLKLDGLQNWVVKEEVVRSMIEGGTNSNRLRLLLEADRKLPRGKLGSALWEAAYSQAGALGKGIRAALGESIGIKVRVIGGPCVSGSVQLSSDDRHLLAWRIGKFEKAKDWLPAWIKAIAAAAAGHSLLTLLLDDKHPNQAHALYRPAVEQQAALATLGQLVSGFLEGSTRPLCYAPQTSEAYWKQPANDDRQDRLARAIASDWWKADVSYGEGEGQSAAARLAWREIHPRKYANEWDQWARAVADPLRTWSSTHP